MGVADDYFGKPTAPARAVVKLGKSSWGSVSKPGLSSAGWSYFHDCTLECGHQQICRSKMYPSRAREDFPAPKYLNCDTCLKEGVVAAPEPPAPAEQMEHLVFATNPSPLLDDNGEPTAVGDQGEHETSEPTGGDSGEEYDEFYDHPPEP